MAVNHVLATQVAPPLSTVTLATVCVNASLRCKGISVMNAEMGFMDWDLRGVRHVLVMEGEVNLGPLAIK